ncbi:hypothetical protein [Dictyobacter arantiisoli]|uniref:hypothetical protein n=1 Tax=Dictyobacter arantiisoli TaxID=2014874 RepID=UPI00155AAB37|nr:hypothetical protein [Dictyobacter arantiisoli]
MMENVGACQGRSRGALSRSRTAISPNALRRTLAGRLRDEGASGRDAGTIHGASP